MRLNYSYPGLAAALLALVSLPSVRLPAQPSQYVAVNINELLGQPNIGITDLNDYGHLVGTRFVDRTYYRPLLWIQGRTYELATPPNQASAVPRAINNAGVVVGSSSSASGARIGLRWTSGLPETLFELHGINGIPSDINEAGDIVGTVYGPDATQSWGFSIIDSVVREFLTGSQSTFPAAINAHGLIVGHTQQITSHPAYALRREGSSNQTFGFNAGTGSSARAVNDAGQIAGEGRSSLFSGRHAFRYRLGSSAQIVDLNPPGANESAGRAIAADGTVFGWAQFDGETAETAMILDGADSIRLADLTLGADATHLARVLTLNTKGWLVVEQPWDPANDDSLPANYLLIPRTAATSTFTNLSVRSELASSVPLIVGTATADGSRQVLARGIGPGLAPYLPTGTPLAGDPALTAFAGGGSAPIATNDDWESAGETADAITTAQAFPLTVGSTDAALVATIDGLATVHLNNTGNAGVALLELFNLDNSNPAQRLVNLSARYQVGTGLNILIAGFIISGDGPKTVLIRGIGPGLIPHGVTGTLADPEIILHNSAGQAVTTNDDWSADLGSAFDAVGAFPLETGSTDAAMIVPLWPGLYTVHLRGADGGTGQGLIEIYDLDL